MEQEKENKEGIDLSEVFKNHNNIKSQDQQESLEYLYSPGTPKIIQWVIKYSGGYIKNEKQANYVLIGFVLVVIITTFFLVFGTQKTYYLTPEEEKLFQGKNSSEKLLLPQKIDENLFTQ